jgi:aryl-alcohol dehydrogenase-like predicted oxidoreductase
VIEHNLSLGCHNLTGGSSYLRSARLVHCALDLGIRRFDVAPSYGLGTAEATLARALGKRRLDPAIEITTKYGIPRPRFGRVAAWVREPYRALSRLRDALATAPAARPASAPAAAGCSAIYGGTARAAIEASLKVMRIDRIAAFLSHERLNAELAERFSGDMTELLREGLVGKVGCSGEIANVRFMLAQAKGVAGVAQVSILHRHLVAGVSEMRLFNLGAIARRIAQTDSEAEDAGTLTTTLRDALSGRNDLNPIGRALAGVLAAAGLRAPEAILIVNASNAERLAAVVAASTKPSLALWAIENEAELDVAMGAII